MPLRFPYTAKGIHLICARLSLLDFSQELVNEVTCAGFQLRNQHSNSIVLAETIDLKSTLGRGTLWQIEPIQNLNHKFCGEQLLQSQTKKPLQSN